MNSFAALTFSLDFRTAPVAREEQYLITSSKGMRMEHANITGKDHAGNPAASISLSIE